MRGFEVIASKRQAVRADTDPINEFFLHNPPIRLKYSRPNSFITLDNNHEPAGTLVCT